MMLTIEEIKKIEPDSADMPNTPTMKAVVLDVSSVEEGTGKPRFYAVLADNTDTITATIYNIKEHGKFVKKMGVMIINVLLKQSYVGVTSRSEVAITKAFEIPEEIIQGAPKLPGTELQNLEQVLHSPVKTIATVKGKISKVSPATTKPVDGEEKNFQELVLKDKTGKATLAIWEDMIGTIEKGQMVRFTKCRVRLFGEEKKLTTTKGTAVEVVGTDEDLEDVSEDEDKADEEAPNVGLPSGSIIGVFDVDPYLSCPTKSCNNTKLVTIKEDKYLMYCKTCHGRFRGSTSNVYMRAVFLLDGENEQKKVTMFAPQIQQMLESRGLNSTIAFDKQEMMSRLFDIIPIQIRYQIQNNTVRNLICKRAI